MLRLLILWCCLVAPWAYAGIDSFEFSNEANRERYMVLVDELRCPKCKNNNLSGSNSMIAMDLKREIHAMVESGATDEAVVDFMVTRYGDFVLYRPRLTRSTWFLWGLPVGLFALAVTVVVLLVRRRAAAAVVPQGDLSPEEQTELARLLALETADKPSSDSRESDSINKRQ